MTKSDKTLKRIHDLFAAKKTPTSLTKGERKELQSQYSDNEEAGFSFKDCVDQTRSETEAQTFSRFEKSLLDAVKRAKELATNKTMTNLRITVQFGQIMIGGDGVCTDAELIKEEHKTWKFLAKQKANEASGKEAAEKMAAKIAEQNALIEELASLLRKPKKSSKPAKKTTKTSK